MGNLLRLLNRDCALSLRNDGSSAQDDIFVDFENAEPAADEKDVWEKVKAVLAETPGIMAELNQYQGAGALIREAITNASKENQQTAMQAVIPLVVLMSKIFHFSKEIESVWKLLLSSLCSSTMSPIEHLESQQALVKQLAEVLDFVHKFDEVKMEKSALQNDLSYYRRAVSAQRIEGHTAIEHAEQPQLDSGMLDNICLFFAEPAPMLDVVTKTTSAYIEESEDGLKCVKETLCTIGVICRKMLYNQSYLDRFERTDTCLFVVRVMVCVIILYDRVVPQGAFIKGCGLEAKECIKLVMNLPGGNSKPLLNALRYSTKHFADEQTPKNIKVLLTPTQSQVGEQ